MLEFCFVWGRKLPIWEGFWSFFAIPFGQYFHISEKFVFTFVQSAIRKEDVCTFYSLFVLLNDTKYSESAKSLFVLLFLVFYRFCLDFYPKMLYYIYI